MLLFVSGPSLTGCSGRNTLTADPVTIRISGSTSMQPLLEDLAAAYQQMHPSVSVEIRAGGSSAGLDEVRAGTADLAAVSWLAEGAEAGEGWQATPIARDGLAVIVHPSNALPGLTILQVRSIYRGDMLDWGTVGGPKAEPLVISREDGSGDRLAFEALVMGEDQTTLGALVMPSARAAADYVAGHPLAIAYVSMSLLDDQVRAVPVEGIPPVAESVRSGAYHLGRLLYLYGRDRASPHTQDFVKFVLSPAGQAIVARHHMPLR